MRLRLPKKFYRIFLQIKMLNLKKTFNKKEMIAERPFWVAFNTFQGIGPQRFFDLLKFFGSAKQAWQAKEDAWRKTNLSASLCQRFFKYRHDFSPQGYFKKLISGAIGKEGKKWSVYGEKQAEDLIWVRQGGNFLLTKPGPIWPMTIMDDIYPPLLKEIDSPPPVLYVKSDSLEKLKKGKFDIFSLPAIAVVGTRRVTGYGRQMGHFLAINLARAGLVVVSSMARGIDAVAHQAALETSGKTVAVLGCGVDVIYPAANKNLYQNILANGAVVSEFPPAMPPLPGNFPSRNRIVSGMSLGTLVIEGGRKSGSLITASLAAEQGREVFAVPGSNDAAMSAGPLYLLKNGAKLTTEANDILEELNISTAAVNNKGRQRISLNNLDKDEKTIILLLENGNLIIDQICHKSGLSISRTNVALSGLELVGLVENLGSGQWGKIR